MLSAAASPVAGALLGLVGLSLAIHQRSARPLLVLALPPALLVGALALLFPEGGYEPYPLLSFLATAVVVIAFLVALPKESTGAEGRGTRLPGGLCGVPARALADGQQHRALRRPAGRAAAAVRVHGGARAEPCGAAGLGAGVRR